MEIIMPQDPRDVGRRSPQVISPDHYGYKMVAQVQADYEESDQTDRYEFFRRASALICEECGRLGTRDFDCIPCQFDAGLDG